MSSESKKRKETDGKNTAGSKKVKHELSEDEFRKKILAQLLAPVSEHGRAKVREFELALKKRKRELKPEEEEDEKMPPEEDEKMEARTRKLIEEAKKENAKKREAEYAALSPAERAQKDEEESRVRAAMNEHQEMVEQMRKEGKFVDFGSIKFG